MSSSSRRTWVTRCRWPRARPWPPSVRSSASRSPRRRGRGLELGAARRRRSSATRGAGTRRRPCPAAGRSAASRSLIASLTSASGEPLARASARSTLVERVERRRRRGRADASLGERGVELGCAARRAFIGASRRDAALARRLEAAGRSPAIATLSDSAAPAIGIVTEPSSRGVERRRRGRGPRCRARARDGRARGRPRRTARRRAADGAEPAPAALARARRAPPPASTDASDHGHPEDRAGRGAHDLGIVGVDRSRRTRRRPSAPDASALRRIVPRLPGIGDVDAPRRTSPSPASAPSRRRAASARHREHRLRRARRADLLEHAFLELDDGARRRASSRVDERRERDVARPGRGRRASSGAPRSSAAVDDPRPFERRTRAPRRARRADRAAARGAA